MMAAELEIKCSLDVAKHVHHVLLATGSREQCGHHGLVVAPARHHQPLPLSAPDCGAEDDWKKLLRSNGQTHCMRSRPIALAANESPKRRHSRTTQTHQTQVQPSRSVAHRRTQSRLHSIPEERHATTPSQPGMPYSTERSRRGPGGTRAPQSRRGGRACGVGKSARVGQPCRHD